MAISNKIVMIMLMAIAVSLNTYSEEQPENAKVLNLAQSLRNTGDFLATSFRNSGDSYEKFSEKVQPYCNPISMAATAFGASFLTRKQFTAITISILGAIYSKNITEMLKTQSSTVKKKISEKLEQLDPNLNNQEQKNSDQNDQN